MKPILLVKPIAKCHPSIDALNYHILEEKLVISLEYLFQNFCKKLHRQLLFTNNIYKSITDEQEGTQEFSVRKEVIQTISEKNSFGILDIQCYLVLLLPPIESRKVNDIFVKAGLIQRVIYQIYLPF